MGKKALLSQGKEKYVHGVFSEIAPFYESMNHLLSFNLDRVWRRRALDRFFRVTHRQILDLCCGTGELTEQLRQRVGPDGSIVGVDFCEQMLEVAMHRHSGVANIAYRTGNARDLAFQSRSFDAVYLGFALRNLDDTYAVFKEIQRVTKPGGQIVALEFTLPHLVLFRWYLTHIVPTIGRVFQGKTSPYNYLADSIRCFYTPQQLRDRFVAEGLVEVEYEEYFGGLVTAISSTVGVGD